MLLSWLTKIEKFVLDNKLLLAILTLTFVIRLPSLFEPFGIVALEAMAAKCPVVVSDTGGLSEIVDHDVTGVKVYPNNTESLAWGITKILQDDNFSKHLRENAYKKILEKYDWDKIAQQTRLMYESVLGEYSKSSWAQ